MPLFVRIFSPNMLTMARILVLPLLILLWLWAGEYYRWWGLAIYTFACITDYLDGYIARNYNIMTNFGRIMDPISDKILVGGILILLVSDNSIYGVHIVAGIIILVREITVSGLREFLQEIKVAMPVSHLAKYKTGMQMVSLGFLVAENIDLYFLSAQQIGIILLWLSSILTIITGYDYLKRGLDYMNHE